MVVLWLCMLLSRRHTHDDRHTTHTGKKQTNEKDLCECADMEDGIRQVRPGPTSRLIMGYSIPYVHVGFKIQDFKILFYFYVFPFLIYNICESIRHRFITDIRSIDPSQRTGRIGRDATGEE
jgi:hypothetical protein